MNFIESYLQMFRFQGWFFHDVTLGIVYGITLLFGFILFSLMFKRKKPKKVTYSYEKPVKEQVFSFPSLVSFCLTWLLFFAIVSHFALFVFGGGLSRNDIEVASTGVMSEELVVTKWRRSVTNKASEEGATRTAHFQLNALDLKKGELRWNRTSNWYEQIIGQSSEGILMLQREKGEVSLIDSRTGEDKWSFEEFEKAFPAMRSNWSKSENDYLVTGESYLYVFGLDGVYYQLDLKAKSMRNDASFGQLFDNTGASQEEGLTIAEIKEKTGKPFFNGKVLAIDGQDVVFIAHSETRESGSQGVITAVNRQTFALIWQTPLGTRLVEQSVADSSLVFSRRQFYYTTNGFSFVINQEDGRVTLVFDHLYNRRVTVAR